MFGSSGLIRAARFGLDFVLPPRCPNCGVVTQDVGLFCLPCWSAMSFLGAGCERCAVPLEATDVELCAACLTSDRHPLDRIRAAVAYNETSRTLILRLKYGRKTAVARTMAQHLRRPLADLPQNGLLVPVPLHRSRLWSRGFNQAALLAAALSRSSGLDADPLLLRRTKRTPKLKGMSPSERRRAVQGAFAVRNGHQPRDRHVILVDDVYTSGSTADACARTLKRQGAASVSLLAWARVVRPARIG